MVFFFFFNVLRLQSLLWRCQIHHQPTAVALCVKHCCGMFLRFCVKMVSLHCPEAFGGGGLVKVKPVICDVTAVRRHPGSHARTHNQTNQTLCNHKTMTWHLSQRNPPLEKRGRSSDGSGSEKKWVEIEREREAKLVTAVCVCVHL